MTITGIISRDGVTPEKPVTEINVLGCRVTTGEDNTIKLDQHGYIQEKLRDRDYGGAFGKSSLPEAIHKKLEPVPREERQTSDFLEYRKLCQEECGVLLWIAGKTRPDLAAAVSMIASAAAFNPKEAFDMIKGVWAICSIYL